jgi:CRP-like cAMP-binding protein
VVNTFGKNDFFGELALLDNVGRSTSAIAKTEGVLLFLDKETFDCITIDLPELLKAVVYDGDVNLTFIWR